MPLLFNLLQHLFIINVNELKLRMPTRYQYTLIQLADCTLVFGGCNGLIIVKSDSKMVDSLFQLENEWLVSGGNKSIQLWNVKTFECIGLFGYRLFGKKISGAVYLIIFIWAISPFECSKAIKSIENSFTQLRDGRLVTSCDESIINVWDVSTHQVITSFKNN